MPTRSIRPGHRGVRGKFPSRKVGRLVAFESRLERDHLLLLEADPRVRTFHEQPVTLHFEGARGRRRYTPDCLVEYHDDPSDLVEVKYAVDLDTLDAEARASLAEAHDAARRHCTERGWRFRVVTDLDIRTPTLERAEALRAFARPPTALPTLRMPIESHLRAHPCTPLADTLAVLAHPEAHACVMHLVWVGAIVTTPAEFPSATTRLAWRGGSR